MNYLPWVAGVSLTKVWKTFLLVSIPYLSIKVAETQNSNKRGTLLPFFLLPIIFFLILSS